MGREQYAEGTRTGVEDNGSADHISRLSRERSDDVSSFSEFSPPPCSSSSLPAETAESLVAGLITGIVQAGLFNPYDRALYLSVKHRRPFLCSVNFANPYLGFAQSVSGRAVSGGLFFPLERFFKSLLLEEQEREDGGKDVDRRGGTDSKGNLNTFFAGSLAGCANALLLNPLSAIKYKTWGRDFTRGILRETRSMWRKGGLKPFLHGLLPTLYRDVAFGGCYTCLRVKFSSSSSSTSPGRIGDEKKRDGMGWVGNMLAAAVATIVSGPFNLARNVQFATRAWEDRESVSTILFGLWRETTGKDGMGGKIKHVGSRLRVGWGTVRVAAGMAFGQTFYDILMGMLVSI